MATILRLTKAKSGEPIRVNFDNVAYYHTNKAGNTVVEFLTPKYYENSLTVQETLAQVDRLLGI